MSACAARRGWRHWHTPEPLRSSSGPAWSRPTPGCRAGARAAAAKERGQAVAAVSSCRQTGQPGQRSITCTTLPQPPPAPSPAGASPRKLLRPAASRDAEPALGATCGWVADAPLAATRGTLGEPEGPAVMGAANEMRFLTTAGMVPPSPPPPGAAAAAAAALALPADTATVTGPVKRSRSGSEDSWRADDGSDGAGSEGLRASTTTATDAPAGLPGCGAAASPAGTAASPPSAAPSSPTGCTRGLAAPCPWSPLSARDKRRIATPAPG